MEKIIGIDLGTTFSAVAHIDNMTKRAEIISDPTTQKLITPSVVFFDETGDRIVGELAKQNALAEPERVVEFVKREIGKPKGVPPEGWSFNYGGKTYSAQEISAFILKKLKQDAENRLGQTISKAAITVPAYFVDKQRSATREAGLIAGLEVLAILDEPMAAAMAYGLDRLDSDQTIFVFDLGGGTFDVTIIEIKEGIINQLAVNGNSRLGGKDWDDKIIRYAAEQFYDQYGTNPLDDLASYQDLQSRAIRAKEELSRMVKSRFTVNHSGQTLRVELTREQFEGLTRDLVNNCRGLCELVLGEAGKTWADIDKILLVGGSTRMPMIPEMVREISGKEPCMDLNPDECVAHGAAWYALSEYIKNLDSSDENDKKKLDEIERLDPYIVEKTRDLRIRNVTSHNLGVIALDGENQRRSFLQIPKGTAVPCEHVDDTFRTVEDNQTTVKIEITEGGLYLDINNCDPAECTVLGEVIIDKIESRPKGSPVEVTMRFNEDKTLEVIGRDILSGKSGKKKIKHPGGLTQEEIDEATELIQKANVTG